MKRSVEPDAGTSLPALIRQSAEIVARLAERGGELDPELEAALDRLQVDVPAKIDAYSAVLHRLEREEDYLRAVAAEHERIARACRKAMDRLRENLKTAAHGLGTPVLRGLTRYFRVSRGKPKLVVDEALLDPEYFVETVVRRPDREAVETALGLGEEVRGARMEDVETIRDYPLAAGDRRLPEPETIVEPKKPRARRRQPKE